MAVLRTIATAPVWVEFDILARAPAVDLIGARFQLPFSPDARVYSFPLIKFAATKEMAYAGASRAAYYLALGQRAEAEAVLRGIISYSFVLKDNGSLIIDELIGDVIVGIGRAALTEYYTTTNDPRAAAITEANETAQKSDVPSPAWSFAYGQPRANRQRLLEIVNSPVTSRAERIEALISLTFSGCSTVADLVLGPRKDIRDAFARVRNEVGRFPSEVALIDLIERTVLSGIPSDGTGLDTRVYDAILVAEKIFLNPRLGSCAIHGLGGR
ncbi:MAG: hypothetical protein O2973_03500 [Gemmatimonadetes bacterium]|nr:hypothetical protein [Gemmatimonadota bacterium]